MCVRLLLVKIGNDRVALRGRAPFRPLSGFPITGDSAQFLLPTSNQSSRADVSMRPHCGVEAVQNEVGRRVPSSPLRRSAPGIPSRAPLISRIPRKPRGIDCDTGRAEVASGSLLKPVTWTCMSVGVGRGDGGGACGGERRMTNYHRRVDVSRVTVDVSLVVQLRADAIN
jgi:hypothetical protein